MTSRSIPPWSALRAGWFAALAVLCWTGPLAAQALPAASDTDVTIHRILASPAFLFPGGSNAKSQTSASRSRPAGDHRDELEEIDPYEGLNRLAHGFNGLIRRHLLEPIAQEWLATTERETQQGVANVFANLREPLTIANNLLLGDLDGASNATLRLVVNTTAGIGGYYDVAAEMGAPRQPRTFEEVLCIYGVPAGPYTVLPVLGPGTVRDAVGRITTLLVSYTVLGPVYIPYRVSDIIVQYVGVREQLKFIDSISVDPYTAQKSATLQVRRMTCEGQSAALIQLFGQQ